MCHSCSEEQRIFEADQRSRSAVAQQAIRTKLDLLDDKEKERKIPFCGACLTTIAVDSSTRLCMRCKAKGTGTKGSNVTGASYAARSRPLVDPNGIY